MSAPSLTGWQWQTLPWPHWLQSNPQRCCKTLISDGRFIRFCFNLSSFVYLKHMRYIFFKNVLIWFGILFCLVSCFFIALKIFPLLVVFFPTFHYTCVFFLFRNFCKVNIYLFVLFIYLFVCFLFFFGCSSLRLSWGEMPGIGWKIPAVHHEFTQWPDDGFEIFLIVFCLPFWSNWALSWHF